MFYRKEFDVSLELIRKEGRVPSTVQSYGMLCPVDRQIDTDVSQRFTASFFKVSSPPYLNCLTLKLKAISSYQTEAAIFYSTGRKISENVKIHQY